MDDNFGGAKPKVKTPRKSHDAVNNEGVSRVDDNKNFKPSTATVEDELNFKEDHFRDQAYMSKQKCEIDKTCKRCPRGRQFVKEFLPLTDEVIKKYRINGASAGKRDSKQLSTSSSETDMNTYKDSEGACKKKKKDLSPTDKWKSSGLALKEYITKKFGLRLGSTKKDSYRKSTGSSCVAIENISPRQCDKNHLEHYSGTKFNINQTSSSQKDTVLQESNAVVNGSDRMKEKHSSLVKVFNLQREERKINQGNSKQDGVDVELSSSNSPCSPPSQDTESGSLSSDWPNNLPSTNHWTFCDCDCHSACTCDLLYKSYVQNVYKIGKHNCEKVSSIDEKSPSKVKKGIKRVERHASKKPLVGMLDNALNSSSDTEKDTIMPSICANRRKRKSSSKDFKRNSHEDCYPEKKLTNESERMSGFVLTGRPQSLLAVKDQQSLEQHNSTKSHHKGSSDVLLGLKYALPYLPQRLRNRLQSSTADQENTDSSLGRNAATERDAIRDTHKDKCIHKSGTSIENGGKDEEILGDTARLEFPRRTSGLDLAIIGTEAWQKEAEIRHELEKVISDEENFENVSETSCLKHNTVSDNVSPGSEKQAMLLNEFPNFCDRTESSNVKFHLNDSGTWTMTNYDTNLHADLIDEGREGSHGHTRGYWETPPKRECHSERLDHDLLKLRGHSERVDQDLFELRGHAERVDRDLLELRGHSERIEQDLLELEASLENPFNLRGDNLVMNSSPPKGNNSIISLGINFDIRYDESPREKQLGICEGLMDIVNGIDTPLVDTEAKEWDSGERIPKGNYAVGSNDMSKETRTSIELTDRTLDAPSFTLSSDTASLSSSHLTLNDTFPEEKWDRCLDNNEESKSTFSLSNDDDIEVSQDRGDNSVDDKFCSDILRMSLSGSEEVKQGLNSLSRSSTLDDLRVSTRHRLNPSRSWYMLSPESSLDADDEFECDCDHCLGLRQHSDLVTTGQQSVMTDTDDLDSLDNTLRSEYLRLPDYFSIQISEPRYLDIASESNLSLGLGVMLENVILQLLTDNVISQMIALRPDLLSEQAPPPALQSVIDDIPTIELSQEDIEQSPVCPVCLCPCGLEETMSQLPCQHIFHPICVQAWLVKSGTCPVCRYRMAPQ